MIAQAEHAEDSASVLLTTSERVAFATVSELRRQLEELPTRGHGGGLTAPLRADRRGGRPGPGRRLRQRLRARAPGTDDRATTRRCSTGSRTPDQSSSGRGRRNRPGDYAAGTNHVLPTGGAAAMYGPLSTESFGRKLQVQELSQEGLRGLRDTVGTLASAEGLPGHRAAVEARFTARPPGEGPRRRRNERGIRRAQPDPHPARTEVVRRVPAHADAGRARRATGAAGRRASSSSTRTRIPTARRRASPPRWPGSTPAATRTPTPARCGTRWHPTPGGRWSRSSAATGPMSCWSCCAGSSWRPATR